MIKIYFHIFFFLVISLHSLFLFSQPDTTFTRPTYDLYAKTVTFDPNELVFDIFIRHTNPTETVFEYAGGQYFFNFTQAFRNLGRLSYFYKLGTMNDTISDLIPRSLIPRSASISADTTYLRLAINVFPGYGNGMIIPDTGNGGYGVRVVRMSFKNHTTSFAGAPGNNIRFKNALSFYTKIFAYTGLNGHENTEVTDSNRHFTDFNTGLLFSPVAYFYSSVRVGYPGESVNIFESSIYSPSTWKWFFPEGNPSESNSRNPVNIQYSSIGNYHVTLIVSNEAGSDTISKENYISVLPYNTCTFNWKTSLKISDAGNVTDSIFFGLSQYGTNGIDTCLGERVIPPPPPKGVYDIRFTLPTNDDSKSDLRKDSAIAYVWTIKLQPSSSGYPFTLHWNTSNLPALGYFYLKDIITGTIVNVNMRDQNSFVLSNPGINVLKIEYSPYFIETISVSSGWNILSVPLFSGNMSTSYLFSNAISPAYSYNNGYVTSDTLRNGKGYWLKFAGSGSYNDTGLHVISETVNINSGWNIIGPFENDLPVNSIVTSPPGILASSFFGYNNGYVISDTLKSGKGYWIKSTSIGTLFNGTDNVLTNSGNDTSDLWTRIEINDYLNNSGNLYLLSQDQLNFSFDLPPVPPSGIFDVRYSTDKFAETFGKDHLIKINSANFPIVIKAFNLGKKKLLLKDAVSGNIVNTELSEGKEIIIHEQMENLIIIDRNSIPAVYSLSQNYPNPFNPETKIDYQLPIYGKVKIVLYDILGKEILTLINEFKEAGNYSLKFRGSSLPSGVYFYRMQAENFTDLKKMLLIK
ncbi:MAG: hypothetical protein HGGPFJEG_02957 [Ignavibacteria bacterium]|nr:hypothetical protein [Ignavibacteria bacterium]